MSTLYPVCVADAHDRMPADRVVAVSGRLILVSGLGSVLGPLIGTSLMARFGIDGVFYLMAAAALLLALVAGGRSLVSASPIHHEGLSRSWPRKRQPSRTTSSTLPTSFRRRLRRVEAAAKPRSRRRSNRLSTKPDNLQFRDYPRNRTCQNRRKWTPKETSRIPPLDGHQCCGFGIKCGAASRLGFCEAEKRGRTSGRVCCRPGGPRTCGALGRCADIKRRIDLPPMSPCGDRFETRRQVFDGSRRVACNVPQEAGIELASLGYSDRRPRKTPLVQPKPTWSCVFAAAAGPRSSRRTSLAYVPLAR